MALARAISIGLAGSFSAMMVSNRCLRRSCTVSLISIQPHCYSSLQRDLHGDYFFQIRRKIVNGVASHQLATGDQIQILDADIRSVAVAECHGVPPRDRAMMSLPDHDVYGPPVSARGDLVIGNFPVEVAAIAHALGPDRHPGLRPGSLFEVPFFAARKMQSSPPFIPWREAFFEPCIQSLTASQIVMIEFRGLVNTEGIGLVINRTDKPAEHPGEIAGIDIRVVRPPAFDLG